jgi:hypothetical protein
LTGLSEFSFIRRHGWLPWHDPDIIATSRALRAVLETHSREGLLRESIRQFHFNHANSPAQKKRSLWFGRFCKDIRSVWPDFNCIFRPMGPPVFSGLPPEAYIQHEEAPPVLSPKSAADSFIRKSESQRWKNRQLELQRSPPNSHQQDWILFTFLQSIYHQLNITHLVDPIFPTWPNISYRLVQDAVRVLSGAGGFARVHSNYMWWDEVPSINTATLKNCCLLCLTTRSMRCIDSEWHMFLECESLHSERLDYLEFIKTLPDLPLNVDVSTLVAHLVSARDFDDHLSQFIAVLSRLWSRRASLLRKITVRKLRAAAEGFSI